MHTGNIYTHWREATDQKRVFILTRSGFAGDQRYAATTWSGDVFSTFQAFTRQIPAGLNFALSGMPYWTTDIAGYGPPFARDTHDPAYQELYTRWYQFGAFCPIFRTHGHRANDENELFSYGPVTPILVSYDKLRYRLLPYIYSLAWKVTSHDSTIMRPLVMDWRTDKKVWNVGDEFMFGPSILVSPVTQKGATERYMYLPPAARWYDFWTGKSARRSTRRSIGPAGPHSAICQSGIDPSVGAGNRVRPTKTRCAHRIAHLSRSRWTLRSLRRPGRHLRLRERQRAIIPIDW